MSQDNKEEQVQEQEATFEEMQKLIDYFKLHKAKGLRYREGKYKSILPGFQVKGDYTVYKVWLVDKHYYLDVIDCHFYESWSGAHFKFCLARDSSGALTPVKGLWFVNINFRKLEVKSNRKLWGAKEDVQIDPAPAWARLIVVTPYGYEAYESAVKAPTLTLRKVLTQGHLEIFDFTEYAAYYNFLWCCGNVKKKLEIRICNHKLTAEKPLYYYNDNINYAGTGHLVMIAEPTKVKLESPDHGAQEFQLEPGAYLFLHRPPRRRVD